MSGEPMTRREEGGPMPAKRSPLPRDRAFVVQLSSDAEATVERLRGRVEHVRSGEAAHFESVEDLLAFVGEQLRMRAACNDPQGSGVNECRNLPTTRGGCTS